MAITLPKVILQTLGEIFFFPLWWYARGFYQFLIGLWSFWREREKSLGLFIWMRNLFVPMYGLKDFWGVVVSFFVRLVQIFLRGLAMIMWSAVVILLVAAWLVLPVFVVYQIAFQLSS